MIIPRILGISTWKWPTRAQSAVKSKAEEWVSG